MPRTHQLWVSSKVAGCLNIHSTCTPPCTYRLRWTGELRTAEVVSPFLSNSQGRRNVAHSE